MKPSLSFAQIAQCKSNSILFHVEGTSFQQVMIKFTTSCNDVCRSSLIRS